MLGVSLLDRMDEGSGPGFSFLGPAEGGADQTLEGGC